MRCEKNEFRIVKMDPEPYQIWSGDKWKCHGCGTEIVVGWARRPVSEVGEEDFQRMLDAGPLHEPLEITDR